MPFYINKNHIISDIKWQPKCANIEYWIPYFRYNQPNASPNDPFIIIHLTNKSVVILPNMLIVDGRWPKANNVAEITFAIINTLVGICFSFL